MILLQVTTIDALLRQFSHLVKYYIYQDRFLFLLFEQVKLSIYLSGASSDLE
jgi:hypothetical protein